MAIHIQKRLMIGALVGMVCGVLWLILIMMSESASGASSGVSGIAQGVLFLLGSVLLGAGYAGLFEAEGKHHVDHLMNGFVFGGLIWFVMGLMVTPFFYESERSWQVAGVMTVMPQLVAYLLVGTLIGVAYGLLYARRGEKLGLLAAAVPLPTTKKQVVILGGGYAGVTAAQVLEHELANDPTVNIWLVSKTNYLVHTPMLSEVSASSVNAQNISPPLRSFFDRVRVVQGEVDRVDLAERMVYLSANSRARSRELSFDHLLLTVGGVPNFYGNEDVANHSFTFKSLNDAIRLRNQVIEMFENADIEDDRVQRRKMLTFVVAGGGFAGVELIGGLNDFTRGILPLYRNVQAEDLRLILVHSRSVILPELSESLGKFGQEKLAERGVEFFLETRVTGAKTGAVIVRDKESGEVSEIPTNTFVWTAGNKPSPVIATLGLPLTRRGKIEVNTELAVPDVSGIWAAGDCALIPDLTNEGNPAPPTAQHALREGKVAGYNIAASLKGKPLKTFKFKTLGLLAALGHQLAVAELLGYRFSGFLAWVMWRAIYLSKLPTFERQLRVGLDWLLDFFFPADIVQTIDFSEKMEIRE